MSKINGVDKLLSETDRSIGLLFHDIARLRTKIYDNAIRDTGLTHAQVFVINHLLRRNGMNQAELADHLGMSAVGVSGIIDRMEARGWIERKPDLADKRAKQVWLTDRIDEHLKIVFSEIGALNDMSLKGLSEAEIITLVGALKKIRRNLLETENVRNVNCDV